MRNRIADGVLIFTFCFATQYAYADPESFCVSQNQQGASAPTHYFTWSVLDELIYDNGKLTFEITTWPSGVTPVNNPAHLTIPDISATPFNSAWQSTVPAPPPSGGYTWSGGGVLLGTIILPSPPYVWITVSDPAQCGPASGVF